MNYLIILYICLIIFGLNYLFFFISFFLKTDTFTDFVYGISFSIIALIILAWKQNFSAYQISIFILINLWAFRLSTYLLIRIRKIKVDHRFDKMRDSFVKLGLFWTLQSVTISAIGLPSFFALSVDANQYFSQINYGFIAFVVVAALALLYETWADMTKFIFYNHRTKEQLFVQTGLWKYSRHPNYFGEIVFWFMLNSIFVFGWLINNSAASDYVNLLWYLSPIYVMLILNFLSGVPLLEIKDYKRYNTNEQYLKYIKSTPCVIPLIGKRGYILRVKKLQSQANQAKDPKQ